LNHRLIAATLCTAAVAAISITPAFAGARHDASTLTAAGSSADAPLFAKAFPAYGHGVQVNYQALGSGTGQKDLNAGTVDFGCFDVPMLKTDGFSNVKKIVQFPVALFGVSIIYNLSGYKSKIKLPGSVLAGIYEGKITKWNASALVKINPALKKVHQSITPVVRFDSSGTTYAFTNYLSDVSGSFVKKYGGPSKTPAWPKTFPTGSHSSGVAAVVKNTPGAIGYVETTYYETNTKAYGEAYIESKDKTWLLPSLKTVTSDASHIGKISPTHFSISNSAGAFSYPISTFSWCGLYQHASQNPATTSSKEKDAVKLFKWEVTTGEEKYGPPLVYPKFPKNIRAFALKQLAKVKP
jgi:phosphate transport system substrate-binding protein